MEKKVDKLIEILKDLTFSKWEVIKNEVDRVYEREQAKSVPNSQLETLDKDLKHWCENLRKYEV